MQIKLATMISVDNDYDYDIVMVIRTIVRAVNETANGPAFVVRNKMQENNQYIYFLTNDDELIDYLHNGYEIVAIVQRA